MKIDVGSIAVSSRKMAALSRKLGREATRLDMRARLIAAMHDTALAAIRGLISYLEVLAEKEGAAE